MHMAIVSDVWPAHKQECASGFSRLPRVVGVCLFVSVFVLLLHSFTLIQPRLQQYTTPTVHVSSKMPSLTVPRCTNHITPSLQAVALPIHLCLFYCFIASP